MGSSFYYGIFLLTFGRKEKVHLFCKVEVWGLCFEMALAEEVEGGGLKAAGKSEGAIIFFHAKKLGGCSDF